MRSMILILIVFLASAGCATSRPKVTIQIHSEEIKQSPDYTVSVTL
jgi:hypothetical protein